MDALRRPPRRTSRPGRRALGVALATLLALTTGACSSGGGKPTALPPQTMTSSGPSPDEPLSTMPEETGGEAAPTVAPVESPAEDTVPTGDGEMAADPNTLVLESGEEEDTSAAAPSLFEAARAERERRRQAGESAIVLDDETLKQYSKSETTAVESGAIDVPDDAVPDDAPPDGEEAAGESGASDGADDPAAEDGEADVPAESDPLEELREKERYWRDRVLELRTDWRHALDRIDELEIESATLRRDFYAEDDPFYRDSQIKPAWDRSIELLEEAERDAERLEADLEATLEEGHRAGALPGWLREGIELEPTEEERAEQRRAEERKGDFHEPSEPVIVDEDGGGAR